MCCDVAGSSPITARSRRGGGHAAHVHPSWMEGQTDSRLSPKPGPSRQSCWPPAPAWHLCSTAGWPLVGAGGPGAARGKELGQCVFASV